MTGELVCRRWCVQLGEALIAVVLSNQVSAQSVDTPKLLIDPTTSLQKDSAVFGLAVVESGDAVFGTLGALSSFVKVTPIEPIRACTKFVEPCPPSQKDPGSGKTPGGGLGSDLKGWSLKFGAAGSGFGGASFRAVGPATKKLTLLKGEGGKATQHLSHTTTAGPVSGGKKEWTVTFEALPGGGSAGHVPPVSGPGGCWIEIECPKALKE